MAVLFAMHTIKRIVLIIIICFIMFSLPADGRLYPTDETADNCYADSSDCAVCCFSRKRSLTRYADWPSIGILHLCTLKIYDTGLMLFGDAKSGTPNQDGVLSGYINFGEDFGCAHISSMPHHGIVTVRITYGPSDAIDFGYLEANLCPGCRDKIMASCGEADACSYKNIFLIDFQTMDFYPLPENLLSFLRNDYYFHIDHFDTGDTVYIIYVPGRE